MMERMVWHDRFWMERRIYYFYNNVGLFCDLVLFVSTFSCNSCSLQISYSSSINQEFHQVGILDRILLRFPKTFSKSKKNNEKPLVTRNTVRFVINLKIIELRKCNLLPGIWQTFQHFRKIIIYKKYNLF